jgi:DNA mismatch endonuclease (patch repair protein)
MSTLLLSQMLSLPCRTQGIASHTTPSILRLMTDVFSKEKRSEVMSRIRGRGNRSTEVKMAAQFRKSGVKGWRRHQDLPGKPDFAFHGEKVAVFVDGCFWHGCPRCYRAPATNAEFWINKIESNKCRDRRVSRMLRASGWSVVRVRECSLKRPSSSEVLRIQRLLSRKRAVNHAS